MRENTMEKTTDKTIITVVGKDTVGIIAKVCTYLASNSINVLDISQTIVQQIKNINIIEQIRSTKKPFADCVKELEQLGEEIGVKIRCQREEIFDMMHRI